MSKRKTVSASRGAVVYCGPAIVGVSRPFAVYRNGIPAALKAKAEEIPAISVLIVPLDQLPQVRRALRTGTGPLYTLYKQVQKKLKGGK